MFLYIWLPFVFLLGAAVGSFLNVCIARLPLEKSVLWPLGSRCGHCFQPIRRFDNIPLLSYWWLHGRCRTCGARFSVRYFVVELLTALGFAGLFYLEVIVNVHRFDIIEDRRWAMAWGIIPWQCWIVFSFHAILFSFLIAAAFCDLAHREIPLSITVPGTFLGLAGAVLWPWPWPYTPVEALQGIQPGQPWWFLPWGVTPKSGLYPWPVWGPLPDWLQPGGNWQTGLATGLAGVLAGTFLLRVVRFLFSTGLGVEALGLGDADLMMMAGSFLGWQPVVVAFFIGVFVGLFLGIGQLVFRGDNALAFGPALAIGVVLTCLGWYWIGPRVQPLFFNDMLVIGVAVVSCIFMLAASYLLRLMRLLRG